MCQPQAIVRLRSWTWLALTAAGGLSCKQQEPAVASATIGGLGGSLASADGQVALEIPPGSLASGLALTIAEARNAPPGFLGKAYEFGPDGTTFLAPVTVAFNYDPSHPAAARIASASGGRWVPEAVVAADRSLHAFTTHLSTWALVPAASGSSCTDDFHYCCGIAGGCWEHCSCVFYRECCWAGP